MFFIDRKHAKEQVTISLFLKFVVLGSHVDIDYYHTWVTSMQSVHLFTKQSSKIQTHLKNRLFYFFLFCKQTLVSKCVYFLQAVVAVAKYVHS